jgi:hypothetical protein
MENKNQDKNQDKHCKCCQNETKLGELQKGFLSYTMGIVIEKNCGYRFLIHLNEYATMIDLYRYVNQFYNHCDEIKFLYTDKDRINLITKNEKKIKEFIYENNIRSCNKEGKPLYLFYLTLI